MKKIVDPQRIEDKSFKIIEGLLADLNLPKEQKEVVKRVIHATVDLDYARGLIFHPCAIEAGLAALRTGKNIVTDVNMVKVGIRREILSGFGGAVACLINDQEVVQSSSQSGYARAAISMRKAHQLMDGGIVAIGNAPTALFEVCDLVRKGKARPALIIGVPVGFVGAAESKKELITLPVPFITNQGGKGGSSVAVAIVNALLKMTEVKGE
ncbi:precorrin-8X/cobalt-precorrin-8 methylmutase [Candidatus Hakubella thermalkaliphila]|uniref:Precorrin-8X/cobalt-precorrin-8 methylmutase n=1 Tax=Candidatus Hakubella thermalkaliphila TaxID=2754717 RepID=A0A6V8NJ97_9ACTN|nr:precorrin-8X methylmutase [Candidatus Hakubella thermalkaliphila]GFP19431.1 precorrin-8X/cobalt-precorrin-8 methylmutase [Candidatus Hakubella thermalkaliphila]GFP38987.1 precorrin-8X/cobalt-precorrin-8 methylmutase [Candidatus Hakubella thermalkaliphila]